MKIYLTKYALTTGIITANAIRRDNGCWAVEGYNFSFCGYDFSFRDSECHTTKKAAIAKAEEMRIKKLQSLDEQIKKISALVFD